MRLSIADEKSLDTFERKILCKIFGPICEDGEYNRRMSHELYELYDDVELLRRVKIGHSIRMDDQAPTKKILLNQVGLAGSEDQLCVRETK